MLLSKHFNSHKHKSYLHQSPCLLVHPEQLSIALTCLGDYPPPRVLLVIFDRLDVDDWTISLQGMYCVVVVSETKVEICCFLFILVEVVKINLNMFQNSLLILNSYEGRRFPTKIIIFPNNFIFKMIFNSHSATVVTKLHFLKYFPSTWFRSSSILIQVDFNVYLWLFIGGKILRVNC